MKHQPAITGRPKKGNKKLRMEVIHGGKIVPKDQASALMISVSERMRARESKYQAERQEQYDLRRASRTEDLSTMARLVVSVEARIVEAVWTERRLPGGGAGGRCGISYLHEPSEIFANAVASGDWHKPHPGSPPPKAIDRMHEPLSWLAWLPRDLAAIVRAAADSKEGNPQANVAWGLVRRQVVAAEDLPVRTLQRRYELGLRTIAVRLASI